MIMTWSWSTQKIIRSWDAKEKRHPCGIRKRKRYVLSELWNRRDLQYSENETLSVCSEKICLCNKQEKTFFDCTSEFTWSCNTQKTQARGALKRRHAFVASRKSYAHCSGSTQNRIDMIVQYAGKDIHLQHSVKYVYLQNSRKDMLLQDPRRHAFAAIWRWNTIAALRKRHAPAVIDKRHAEVKKRQALAACQKKDLAISIHWNIHPTSYKKGTR